LVSRYENYLQLNCNFDQRQVLAQSPLANTRRPAGRRSAVTPALLNDLADEMPSAIRPSSRHARTNAPPRDSAASLLDDPTARVGGRRREGCAHDATSCME